MAQPPPVRQIAEDSWERTHPIKTAPPVDLSWICQNASCSTSNSSAQKYVVTWDLPPLFPALPESDESWWPQHCAQSRWQFQSALLLLYHCTGTCGESSHVSPCALLCWCWGRGLQPLTGYLQVLLKNPREMNGSLAYTCLDKIMD